MFTMATIMVEQERDVVGGTSIAPTIHLRKTNVSTVYTVLNA